MGIPFSKTKFDLSPFNSLSPKMKIIAALVVLSLCAIASAELCNNGQRCSFLLGKWDGEIRIRGYSRGQSPTPVAISADDLACADSSYTIPYTCSYFYDDQNVLRSSCHLYPTTLIDENEASLETINFYFNNVISEYTDNAIYSARDTGADTCIPAVRITQDQIILQFNDLFST